MKQNLLFFILLPAFLLMRHLAAGQTVFINEFHYDNSGQDMEEGIEIAGPSGTPLEGWSLVLYNGSNGTLYQTIDLSGILPDQQSGFGTLFFAAPGLQNGSPDGMALVNDAGEVAQFLSYEGTFTASGGPADGMLSEDVGVEEVSSTAIGYSLQLVGDGSAYEDFSWAEAQTSTYVAVNSGQTFLPLLPVLFINEIHYDNSGSDTNEGVEIAGTAGLDLSLYSLVAYNGNNGEEYNTVNLEGIIPNHDNGYGTIFFSISGLQNGAPDGIALVLKETGEVIQFLSYEGNFTAVGGPADGVLSEDIGVEEGSGTPANFSLQLAGEGAKYEDFSWEGPLSSTFNQVNANQSFGGDIVTPDPEEVTIAEARALPLGTEIITYGILTVTDQLGGPAFLQDSTGGIAVFDEQIHANDTLQIGDSLKIAATIGAFNDQIQLIQVTDFVNFGPANAPVVPQQVTVAQVPALEGELVTLQASFVTPDGLFFPNSNYEIQDGTGTTEVRIDDNVDGLIGKQVPQDEVSITGVIGSFRGTAQIFPRFEADLPAEPYEPIGDTISASRTLDVATWNMEFFGADIDNFGPSDIQLQLENAKEVIEALEADIIAVQEISSDSLLSVLAQQLEGNWEVRCSDVYSYSFEAPDPNFPPQKLCYLYNTAIVEVVQERVVFDDFYTEVRTSGDESLLPGYPTTVSSFWASGRLPYQLTVNATLNGATEQIHLFNIHGISNSGGVESYERRMYDVQVLKDTLDTYFPNESVIVLGDYNDDVDEPVADEVTSDFSPYEIFVEDSSYFVTTYSLSEAGFRSYVFEDNMIDHLTISDELRTSWIEGSEITFLPFELVDNYSSTTSDHLPVRVRFEMAEPLLVEIKGETEVFYGYAPEACTTLSANVIGGSDTLSYLWNTGETTPSITVCPTESQVYTLTVTDNGHSVSEEIYVCVTDVNCGGNASSNLVELCYSPRNAIVMSLCLPQRLATFLLRRGASLGSCYEQDNCDMEEEAVKDYSFGRNMEGEAAISLTINDALSVRQDHSRGETIVNFVVLEEGRTTLSLYNATGQHVRTLHSGSDQFGKVHELSLQKSALPSGLYFLRLTTASGAVFSKQVIL